MEADLSKAAEWLARSKIRLAKIKEISKAWNDLFFILAGEEVFKKIPDSDYSSFEKSMRESLEEAWHPPLSEGHTTGPPPADLLNQLNKFLSVDYIPPQDRIEMAVDLIHLAENVLPSGGGVVDLNIKSRTEFLISFLN